MGCKLLPADWHKRLQLVQRKVAEAAKLENGDATLKPEGHQDYWTVLALRDQLAASAARSLLGGLTGPAATWDKLVRAYESRSMHRLPLRSVNGRHRRTYVCRYNLRLLLYGMAVSGYHRAVSGWVSSFHSVAPLKCTAS